MPTTTPKPAESRLAGRPLEQLCRAPMEISTFLRIAVRIAAAVGELHRSGLTHKDLKPDNILIEDEAEFVHLIDSSISSRLPREPPPVSGIDTIQGTLAYMSPEQTGRMNRWIDSRTDLYSLGVTFYQMLTGRLPFEASDALEWVHCHVARSPRAPIEIAPAIPGPISEIVLKLLAKAAEERYQSAAGLRLDLERCLEQWLSHGRIEPFPLGARDVPERLQIPQRLYGREAEVERLLGVFDRIARSGAAELVLVSGYPGVGKSALVNELHRPVVRERGVFASGKFDQYKRNIPYATLDQAFRQMVLEILTESEERVGLWRERLRDALGPNGRLIIDRIPEVELIIGAQPAVPELLPAEAQSRFQRVVLQFLGAFTRPDHPVVLFLDDLQWADAASLQLLEHIITHPDTRYLLLIGAFRDNEVSPSHPLMLTLDRVRAAGAAVSDIVLSPLSTLHLGGLVADALHRRPEEVESLARLMHERTAGNPFFGIQFLLALQEERLIERDPVEAVFRWDVAKIAAKGFTDNVVDLVVGKLLRLPARTQEALKHLACLGNTAEVALLSMIHGGSVEETDADLWEAVRAGLVLRLSGAYKFLHDRVQEAAYSRIPEGERAAAHLAIGRLLLAGVPEEAVEERLFDIVDHFNRGATLLGAEEETTRVAELNLRAGRKAKAATAYLSAIGYLARGQALLSSDAWDSRYALAYGLHLERARCEWLCGNFEVAAGLLAALLTHARGRADQMAAYRIKVDLHTTQGQVEEAALTTLTACEKLFGLAIPLHPTQEALRATARRVLSELGERPIEDLIHLPPRMDPEMQGLVSLLSMSLPAAYSTDPVLHDVLCCEVVSLSLRHGNTEGSPHGYVTFGATLGGLFERWSEASRFGKLARALVDKRGFSGSRASTDFTTSIFIDFWVDPLHEVTPRLERAFQSAVEHGDMNHACYASGAIVMYRLMQGDPLPEVAAEAERQLDFTQHARYEAIHGAIDGMARLVRALRGKSGERAPAFDPAEVDAGFTTVVRPWHPGVYYICKTAVLFLAGDDEGAVATSIKAREAVGSSWAPDVECCYWSALALCAHAGHATKEEQRAHLATLAGLQEQHRIWKERCPQTFLDRYALVSAEIARAFGRAEEAARLYEEAIRAAHENGFVHHEAIAYELASRFYRTRGFERFADTYLRDARACYARWGADRKVRQIDQQHPHLAEPTPLAPTASFAVRSEQLDLLSVTKASQSISSEILLPDLEKTLIRIVIEAAGAQKGYLLRRRGDELFVAIEAVVEEGGREVRILGADAARSAARLPASILHYVKRTRELVLLDDAAKEARFAADPVVAAERPRSVLCLPLTRQAELVGLLYLENNLAAGAFTPDRIAVLLLLASQAAISLENATLYAQVRELNEALEARVLSRTAELSAANKELEAFSYSVSHDLRAPLRTIDTFSLALAEDCGDALGEKGQRHLARVRRATQRTLELIDDLLKLSRVGRGEIVRRKVDLSALGREVVAELAREDPGRRVEIVIAGGLSVHGDERLLRGALENLLRNAWKFTGKRESARIELGALLQEDGRPAYYVRDNGAGFDMAFADRLFTPFYRMHKESDFPGTGVGLATVQRIVHRHGGRLWAESAVEEGATFYFTL